MSRDIVYKCTICGKFISYEDINNNKVYRDFTPDSDFTTECTSMTHKECLVKNKNKVEG